MRDAASFLSREATKSALDILPCAIVRGEGIKLKSDDARASAADVRAANLSVAAKIGRLPPERGERP